MNKEMYREFLNWLDIATTEELSSAREKASIELLRERDRDLKADYRKMIKLIDQEFLTRFQISIRK